MAISKVDCIEKTFNKLTVLKYEVRGEKQVTYFYCRCECGNEKWIQAGQVKNGRQKSCGCLKKQTNFEKYNLKGKRFGKLTVLREFGKGSRGFIWECKCDCGKTIKVVNDDITRTRAKDTASCGCNRKKGYTDEELLNLIKEKAKELGRVPRCREMKEKSTIEKRFGTWNKALGKAGF